jgi:ABC-type glycerol-3-phosphate transport system substrate-binding protein
MLLSRRVTLLLMMVALSIVGLAPLMRLQAQDNPITLSLAIPNGQGDFYNEKLVATYEASHLGIKLNLVKEPPSYPTAAQDLDKHFEGVQKYVQSADVLAVDLFSMSPEATRAGYFLDLAPLVNDDKTINTDDFFPTLWQSFQWDKGIWALPVNADAIVLSYKPVAFDKAGLAYPNYKWTFDDLENAIRTLAIKDSSGKVTTAGIDIQGVIQSYLLRIAANQKLFDDSTIPNTPKLATEEIAALLDRWKKLDDEGYIGQDFNKAPLSLSAAVNLLFNASGKDEDKLAGAPFPGGKSALSANGFAVSGGTQHPQEAYELAVWLTTRAEIVNNGFTSSPARMSLVGKSGGDAPISVNITPEIQALIDQAVANGITLTDLRYVDYLAVAYAKMKSDKLDAFTALQQVEAAAVQAQVAAGDKKDKLNGQLVVATPAPQAAANGEVTLKFVIGTFNANFPNKDKWQKVTEDFAASDAQVGAVTIETSLGDIASLAKKADCIYLPYNPVTGTAYTALLSLDPFLASDTAFDKADIMPGLLDRVMRENKIYALPADIQPNVLKYNTEAFKQAGVSEPQVGWTISDFQDVLKQLKTDANPDAPFAPSNTAGSYMLSLITAFGGLPLDYRSNPPIINYSDPKTVEAIRQVLDLAKNGYIKYKALGGQTMDLSPAAVSGALVQESLGAFSFRFGPLSTDAKFKYVLYPQGTDYSAVTYNMGTLSISASSANPDACYRLISKLASDPTLFSAMPVRRSLLNSPELVAAQGQDIVELYKQIDTLLQNPDVIKVPVVSLFDNANTDVLLYLWLYRAFDGYVLEGKDLEAALKDAEMQGKTFQECQATIPTFDASSQDSQKVFLRAFRDCALKADPSLKPLFDQIKID